MPEPNVIYTGNIEIKEAIILAGGLGTRLMDAVPDLPKVMAPVNDHPFLYYVINYWRSQGIERFIFSLGYKHENIEEYLNTQFRTLNFHCSVEKEPLGTGGAIFAAGYFAENEQVLVTNGDTLFKANIEQLSKLHFGRNAQCTLALKPLQNFDRYGAVEISEDGLISKFSEKKYYKQGNINGGVYLLDIPSFLNSDFPEKFSFEKEYLENCIHTNALYGQVQDNYFIDIGIPEDYQRAALELKKSSFNPGSIDKSWTLFLDRDGVINYEKENDYILNKDEFRFYEGVPEAIRDLSGKFGKIIIVTNQRGIGRGMMTEQDLEQIHEQMKEEIEKAGGRIDAIYYCTETETKAFCRKPNPGMAFLAKKDFPEIDLNKSVIAGNRPGDMLFGRFAGMYTVFIATTHPEIPFPNPDTDSRFNSLTEFAKAL